ncbi:MAG TPA: type II toxin-antitoxin system VapB family antitoxin [Phycisphaerae bacterium]|nr:type II toxin-antitoxin system VapB family antitoxin [Phycisphaerae bacterium]
MKLVKIFKIGRSQAVKIPKDFEFQEREVAIVKLGETVMLYPVKKGWEVMEKGIGSFTEDFMSERNQLKAVRRRAVKWGRR